jgi:hypothetical protein
MRSTHSVVTTLAHAVARFSPTLLNAAEWIYGEPSKLVARDGERVEHLELSNGVRQGDPLGPLLFSIGPPSSIESLQQYLGPQYLVMAYLDDIVIFGSGGDILDKVQTFSPPTTRRLP